MSFLSSETIEQGDIITLELPFSDISGSKLRPVLVLSNFNFNQSARDVIVAKITGSSYDEKYEVILEPEDLVEGKLKKTSYIDSGFIMTVEQNLIRQKIAKIRIEILTKAMKILNSIFS